MVVKFVVRDGHPLRCMNGVDESIVIVLAVVEIVREIGGVDPNV